MILQGEIYWVDLPIPIGSEPGYRRPGVVIQNTIFNASRVGTVIVCLLTANLQRAGAPGNVLLEPGEGSLPQQSVVNVSHLLTVDKRQLCEPLGQLSSRRVSQILHGVDLWLRPREPSY